MKEFLQRIKNVKIIDLFSIFPMLCGYTISLIFRLSHRRVWLICERENEARDNGYWFFKYMCEEHPEIESVYAINKNSVDYSKVAKIGRVIQFGSIMHWIHYFVAKKNISSQKEGKPNAALCFFMEVYLGTRKNRVYLKHGIIKDSQRWIYYDVSKFSMICTTSKREQSFIRARFGYPHDSIKLVGMCRFDNLLEPHEMKKQILVMPTMREWLRNISNETLKYEKSTNIKESEFFITWEHFLQNKDLHILLECYKYNLLFYLHPAMQKYSKQVSTNCDLIKIATAIEFNMQELLMESSILITDYSSIFFDFAYMKKPLIYYQFDYEKYRRGQYQEGYFSYQNDGFGPVVNKEEDLLEKLSMYINHSLMEKKYEDRVDAFFEYRDQFNCERTYTAISSLD